MEKNTIRLTESQLHRVIKESVNRVLNEIRFGGESLHGNNPVDWTAIEKTRDAIRDFYPNETDPSHYGKNSLRDLDNASELYTDEVRSRNPNIGYTDYQKGWQDIRVKGNKKANMIRQNIGV